MLVEDKLKYTLLHSTTLWLTDKDLHAYQDILRSESATQSVSGLKCSTVHIGDSQSNGVQQNVFYIKLRS